MRSPFWTGFVSGYIRGHVFGLALLMLWIAHRG